MTDLDIYRIERDAKAALEAVGDEYGNVVMTIKGWDAISDFQNTATPATVLALVAALQRARAESERMAGLYEEACRHCAVYHKRAEAAEAEAAQIKAHLDAAEIAPPGGTTNWTLADRVKVACLAATDHEAEERDQARAEAAKLRAVVEAAQEWSRTREDSNAEAMSDENCGVAAAAHVVSCRNLNAALSALERAP